MDKNFLLCSWNRSLLLRLMNGRGTGPTLNRYAYAVQSFG